MTNPQGTILDRLPSMGLISHSHEKLAEGDKVIIRIGNNDYHEATFIGCTRELGPLRHMASDARFTFRTRPFGKHVYGIFPSKPGCRNICEVESGRRLNIFVDRIGKFASLRPYSQWKRNMVAESSPAELESLPVQTMPEWPSPTLLSSPNKSAVIPFTRLPQEVLETIARCKLNGTLDELVRVSKAVSDGTTKLGITVSVEL